MLSNAIFTWDSWKVEYLPHIRFHRPALQHFRKQILQQGLQVRYCEITGTLYIRNTSNEMEKQSYNVKGIIKKTPEYIDISLNMQTSQCTEYGLSQLSWIINSRFYLDKPTGIVTNNTFNHVTTLVSFKIFCSTKTNDLLAFMLFQTFTTFLSSTEMTKQNRFLSYSLPESESEWGPVAVKLQNDQKNTNKNILFRTNLVTIHFQLQGKNTISIA